MKKGAGRIANQSCWLPLIRHITLFAVHGPHGAFPLLAVLAMLDEARVQLGYGLIRPLQVKLPEICSS